MLLSTDALGRYKYRKSTIIIRRFFKIEKQGNASFPLMKISHFPCYPWWKLASCSLFWILFPYLHPVFPPFLSFPFLSKSAMASPLCSSSCISQKKLWLMKCKHFCLIHKHCFCIILFPEHTPATMGTELSIWELMYANPSLESTFLLLGMEQVSGEQLEQPSPFLHTCTLSDVGMASGSRFVSSWFFGWLHLLRDHILMYVYMYIYTQYECTHMHRFPWIYIYALIIPYKYSLRKYNCKTWD